MPKRTRTTRRLEVWLKDTDLALFVLNAQRRLVFFNRGCERLTGWAAADVLGQQCLYVSEAEPQTAVALLAALAPPPTAWQGTLQQVPIHLPRHEHPPIARLIHYFPLVDDSQAIQAMLGVIADMPRSVGVAVVPASQQLHAELAALRQAVRRRYGEGTLIGRSRAVCRAFDQVRLAQTSQSPVLFLGESGTGKQHLARALHSQGLRGRMSFVPLDCRTGSEELGQTLARIRESSEDALGPGTLYLERVDALPADVQQQLVHWLTRDDTDKLPRVMASASRPLLPLVESDRFSRDLYYLLTSLVIELPPLRERVDDLEPLAQYFLEELNRSGGHQVGGFADEVLRQFRRYNWPGNVAELRQVITESHAACDESLVRVEHLPFRFRTGVTAQTMAPRQRVLMPLDRLLEQVEREQIERALQECRDNKARAAELLEITRPRLYRRMEVLGIVDPETPPAAMPTTPAPPSEVPPSLDPANPDD